MGVFGLGEIIRNLEHEHTRSVMVKSVSGLWLSKDDFKRIIGPVLRGTGLGSVLGILPGGGAMLASFAAYTLEKRLSPNKAQFGKGAIEGVAAPEAANNAGAQTSFIPMLTLGIPSNPVMALMIGALIIQGITPGPNVVTDEPALFWGLIVSMWVGNLMLVLLNLPLIGMWVKMLTIPYHLLFPAIIAFCCIGAYSVNNNVFDVYAMAGFGLVGWALIKLDFEPAPLLLGFVLGPMLEENLRRAMIISRGDATVFVTHPLSLALLLDLRRPPHRRPPPQHPRQTRGSLSGVDPADCTEWRRTMIKDPGPCGRDAGEPRRRLQAALALAARLRRAGGRAVPRRRAVPVGQVAAGTCPTSFVREHLAHAGGRRPTSVLARCRRWPTARGQTLGRPRGQPACWTGCRCCSPARAGAPT